MKIEIPDKYFNSEELENTPERIQRFYKEWFTEAEEDFKFTTFKSKVKGIVALQDIPLESICSHHLLPYKGTCNVIYVPYEGKICGISKLARTVDKLAHKPTIQEELTAEIADFLMEKLQPQGVMITMKCEHQCMSIRGVRKQGMKMCTSEVRGIFLESSELRDEAMRLIGLRSD